MDVRSGWNAPTPPKCDHEARNPSSASRRVCLLCMYLDIRLPRQIPATATDCHAEQSLACGPPLVENPCTLVIYIHRPTAGRLRAFDRSSKERRGLPASRETRPRLDFPDAAQPPAEPSRAEPSRAESRDRVDNRTCNTHAATYICRYLDMHISHPADR